jgi:hypothetical protein
MLAEIATVWRVLTSVAVSTAWVVLLKDFSEITVHFTFLLSLNLRGILCAPLLLLWSSHRLILAFASLESPGTRSNLMQITGIFRYVPCLIKEPTCEMNYDILIENSWHAPTRGVGSDPAGQTMA